MGSSVGEWQTPAPTGGQGRLPRSWNLQEEWELVDGWHWEAVGQRERGLCGWRESSVHIHTVGLGPVRFDQG